MKINTIPVFYINLDKDVDKKNKLENYLAELEFDFVRCRAYAATSEDGVIQPNKWVDPGYYNACRKSFLYALRKPESTPFILLEDDATPTPSFKDKVLVPEDTDVMYLGGGKRGLDGVHVPLKTKYPGVLKPTGMLTAHAILVNTERGRKTLMDAIMRFPDIIQDFAFAKAQASEDCVFYAISPPIFYQPAGPTDTRDPYTKNKY